jgi:hypothetical protein
MLSRFPPIFRGRPGIKFRFGDKKLKVDGSARSCGKRINRVPQTSHLCFDLPSRPQKYAAQGHGYAKALNAIFSRGA